MGRSKIKLELIEDHKKRKSTFVKRKASLVKKISELSILCGIKACMIMYEGNNQDVEIWQNDPNDVEELINLYKNQPLEGRITRAKTLSSFFQNDRKKKAEFRAGKYPTWDSRFDCLSEKELRNLVGVLEKRMENAKGKAEFLKFMKAQDSNIGSSSLCHQEIWDYPELMNNNCLNQTTNIGISSLCHQAIWDYPELMNNDCLNQTTPNIGSSSICHQEIWDYPELMNNDNLNQTTTPWPIPSVNPFTDHNYFFQDCVNSMGAGMDNGLLTIDDYQFGYEDYTMKIEAECWLENNGIGSSSTMQPMGNINGIGSSSTMEEYPFIYNGSTHMPFGFQ